MAINREEIQETLLKWISRTGGPEKIQWLREKSSQIKEGENIRNLQLSFSMVPRKLAKTSLEIYEEDKKRARELREEWQPENLDTWQAARIYLILSYPSIDPEEFTIAIHQLLSGSDMNEQIAVYAGLPVFPFPENLLPIAYEGTRSNITDVFDTITLNNPYPKDHFEPEEFNRLVLKAAFMERPFMKIVGIPERTNPTLAGLLLDLISERWAAGREVNPMLWKLIAPSLNPELYNEFRDKAKKQDQLAQAALALSFRESSTSSGENENSMNWNNIQKEWETRQQI